MHRFTIATAIGAVALNAVSADAQNITTVPRTQANAVSCPLSEIRFGIGMALPDPWFQTIQVATEPWNDAGAPGPYTIIVNGKEMLTCRWKPDKEKMNFAIRRPASPQPPETWPCPAQVTVRVLSPLPSPWMGTQYPAQLVSKTQQSIAGIPENRCTYEGLAPAAIVYPMPVTTQQPVGGLAANPRTLPASNDLKQGFFVTKAQLTAIGAIRTTSCPATVRFQGRIATNGPGQVRWRREINGQQGPIQTLNFATFGEKVVQFETQVAPVQQTGPLSLTTQTQPSNVVNGQVRIVIESPQGVSESNTTEYRITCSALAPTGNLSQTPPPSPPAPQTLAATGANPSAPAATQPATATGTAPGRTTAATARGASGSRRIEFASQRIPVRVRDGRTGWAQFNVSGQIGGRAAGRITLSLSAPGSRATATTYQIQNGVVQYGETDYAFILHGSAQTAGEATSRRFSSQLKLVPRRSGGVVWTPGGVSHTDNWREQAMATGDVWVIDGLTCQFSGTDLVCL